MKSLLNLAVSNDYITKRNKQIKRHEETRMSDTISFSSRRIDKRINPEKSNKGAKMNEFKDDKYVRKYGSYSIDILLDLYLKLYPGMRIMMEKRRRLCRGVFLKQGLNNNFFWELFKRGQLVNISTSPASAFIVIIGLSDRIRICCDHDDVNLIQNYFNNNLILEEYWLDHDKQRMRYRYRFRDTSVSYRDITIHGDNLGRVKEAQMFRAIKDKVNKVSTTIDQVSEIVSDVTSFKNKLTEIVENAKQGAGDVISQCKAWILSFFSNKCKDFGIFICKIISVCYSTYLNKGDFYPLWPMVVSMFADYMPSTLKFITKFTVDLKAGFSALGTWFSGVREAQFTDSLFPAVAGLFTFIFAAPFGALERLEKKFPDFIRLMTAVVVDAPTVFSKLMLAMEKSYNYIHKLLYGVNAPIPLGEFNDLLEAINRDFKIIYSQGFFDDINSNDRKKSLAYNLLTNVIKAQEGVGKRDLELSRRLSQMRNEAVSIVNKVNAISVSPLRARTEPISLIFHASPGIGKSVFTNIISAVIVGAVHVLDLKDVVPILHKFVYQAANNVSGADNFANGYSNQLIYMLDDFGQMVDSIQSPNLDFIDFIRYYNTAGYSMPQACLEAKGKTPFTSEFIIASANIFPFNPKSLNAPSAINRRWDFIVKLELKQKYKKDEKIDMSALDTAEGQLNADEIWSFKLFRWNQTTESEEFVKDILFLDLVKSMLNLHAVKHSNNVQSKILCMEKLLQDQSLKDIVCKLIPTSGIKFAQMLEEDQYSLPTVPGEAVARYMAQKKEDDLVELEAVTARYTVENINEMMRLAEIDSTDEDIQIDPPFSFFSFFKSNYSYLVPSDAEQRFLYFCDWYRPKTPGDSSDDLESDSEDPPLDLEHERVREWHYKFGIAYYIERENGRYICDGNGNPFEVLLTKSFEDYTCKEYNIKGKRMKVYGPKPCHIMMSIDGFLWYQTEPFFYTDSNSMLLVNTNLARLRAYADLVADMKARFTSVPVNFTCSKKKFLLTPNQLSEEAISWIALLVYPLGISYIVSENRTNYEFWVYVAEEIGQLLTEVNIVPPAIVAFEITCLYDETFQEFKKIHEFISHYIKGEKATVWTCAIHSAYNTLKVIATIALPVLGFCATYKITGYVIEQGRKIFSTPSEEAKSAQRREYDPTLLAHKPGKILDTVAQKITNPKASQTRSDIKNIRTLAEAATALDRSGQTDLANQVLQTIKTAQVCTDEGNLKPKYNNRHDIPWDTCGIDIRKKLWDNMFLLFASIDGKLSRLGQVWGVFGRVLCAPAHYITKMRSGDHLELFRYQSGVWFNFDLKDVKVIYIKDEEKPDINYTDRMLLEMPDAFPMVPDIRKHIMTKRQAESLSFTPALLMQINVVKEKVVIRETVNLLAKAKAYDKIDTFSQPGEIFGFGGIQTIKGGWEYSFQGLPGDCGALLMAVNEYLECKIIGQHSSGLDGLCFGTLIYREMFDVKLSQCAIDWELDSPLIKNPLATFMQERDGDIIYTYQTMKPEGNFWLLGSTDRKVQSSLSSVERSVLAPYMDYGPMKSPAILKPIITENGIMDPLIKGFNKLSKDSFDVQTDILEDCMADVFSGFEENSDKYKKILTIEEAVFGDPDIQSCSLNLNSSPGFPYNKKKGPFNGTKKRAWIDDYKRVISEELKMDVNELVEKARLGIRSLIIYNGSLKDELRESSKANPKEPDKVKTRFFSGCPQHYAIACKQYFGGFAAYLQNHPIDTGCCVGINPYKDWRKLAAYISTKGSNVFDGDFSDFDGSLNAKILWKICEYINKWYNDGEENARIRHILFCDVVFAVYLVEALLIAVGHGNPSGNILTSIINCIYVLAVFRYLFVILGMRHNYPATMVCFRQNVALVVYGDDHVVNVSDRVAWFFNQVKLSEMFPVIGMTYTSAKKDQNFVPYTQINNVTFLKRSFPSDLSPYGLLDLSVIREMVLWNKKGTDPIQNLIDTINFSLFEMSLHGEDLYNEHRNRIISALKDLSKYRFFIQSYLPSYREQLLVQSTASPGSFSPVLVEGLSQLD